VPQAHPARVERNPREADVTDDKQLSTVRTNGIQEAPGSSASSEYRRYNLATSPVQGGPK